MKTIKIYIACESDPGRDDDVHYFFSEALAHEKLSDIAAHLTESEKKHRNLYYEGYSVRIPDDYTVTTAEQLNLDLCNGDVESPDFDICTCLYTSKQLTYKEIT